MDKARGTPKQLNRRMVKLHRFNHPSIEFRELDGKLRRINVDRVTGWSLRNAIQCDVGELFEFVELPS